MFTSRRAPFALILFVLFLTLPLTRARAVTVATDYPIQLIIPSIGLSDKIQGVGVTTAGAIDVPSGYTQNVGWYKYGTIPGSLGSAVLDAHVFAAFKDLKSVPSGADIYVVMHSGTKLHFVVMAAQNYTLSQLTSDMLMGKQNGAYMNLITCSGNLTPDRSTYDHRLVLYTALAGVETKTV